jgi:hypothetical protein
MIQAPSTMKSVVQAAWLWTVAFGNLIVIIVAEGKSESLSQVSFSEMHKVVNKNVGDFKIIIHLLIQILLI